MSEQLDTIEKLIQFMEKHDLAELAVRQGDLEFKARRGDRKEPSIVFQPAHSIVQAPAASAAQPAAPAAQAAAAAPEAKTAPGKGQKEICSPIVGTFYRRPNPTAPFYKDVGDRVEKEDTVCIVEAMKVMNEIKAECTGKIVKVLVEDAKPVEYGQPLFLVELA
ncbi:MAG: acetyl-CoA carboxylase biotin carboxyl carrier protein [Planctomycetota bacterium]|nr:acetyl-CoA carboxylase biotin carboxyl carrier protein [Planctomycetota bacterium]